MTKFTDAVAYNSSQLAKGALTSTHVTMLVELWQKQNGLTIDGKAGPNTIASIEEALKAQGSLPPMPAERCWPLRCLPDGRKPTITSAFRPPDRLNHNGCDLFYAYLPTDPPMKIGDGGRTRNWWIPLGTYAVAQADGVVVLAGPIRTGYRVWIEHAGGWKTGGFHFDKLADGITVGATVKMGDPVGRVSDNPIDNDADHLHTELYFGELGVYPSGLLDPATFWLGAKYLPSL
jgi:murein DD-endopeptidase MepM/ murein hydrolase activator NlpD